MNSDYETDALPEDVGDILQEEPAVIAVPVRQEGIFLGHELPSRSAPAASEPLGLEFRRVLVANKKRKAATLIADVEWLYSHTGSAGSGVRWPADTPLVLGHCDEVHAAVPTGSGVLSVIPENWAD